MPTPVYELAFGEKQQFEDVNGNPLVGGKLFVYTAGTATKVTTYQETDGVSANTNPIILDGTGALPKGVYVVSGLYKIVLAPSTDSDPPVSAIWTRDQISPMGTVSIAPSEWVVLDGTLTWVSASSFTVSGDVTPTAQVGRRMRVVDSGGTKYGYITSSTYGAPNTTIVVALDSGSLVAPVVSVDYSFLSGTNPSVPLLTDSFPIVSGSLDNSKKIREEVDGLTTATTRVRTSQDRDIVIASQDETQDAQMLQNASLAASVAGNNITIALKNAAGSDCSSSSPATIGFRSTTIAAGSFSVRKVTAALSLTITAGSTLGFANIETGRIHVGLIDNAGTVELCAWRALVGLDVLNFPEWTLQSTTAEGSGTADSAGVLYSTTVRSNIAFRYFGSFDIQYGTAQWSNAPSLVQTATRDSPRPGDILNRRVSYTGNKIASAGALGSGTTLVPNDDTIPINSEGDEYLILTNAAISAVNLLRINWIMHIATASPATGMITFLNKDSAAANSVAAVFGDNGAGNAARIATGEYLAVAGNTSSATWRVRAGPATAATMYANGSGGTRLFGGALLSRVKLEEIFV